MRVSEFELTVLKSHMSGRPRANHKQEKAAQTRLVAKGLMNRLPGGHYKASDRGLIELRYHGMIAETR